MGGLSSELLLGGNGIGDALSTTRRATDDAAALASALERLLNVSALQNVTCDAVQLLPNRTMQCAFVGMSPDCSHHVRVVWCSLLVCLFVCLFVLRQGRSCKQRGTFVCCSPARAFTRVIHNVVAHVCAFRHECWCPQTESLDQTG